MNFDYKYKSILKSIMKNGIEELNIRTNTKLKALPGISFSLDIGKTGLPVLGLRKLNIKVSIAEMIWFISGVKDISFLQQYTKIWDSFLEEDGTLAIPYGYRWKTHFGRDQLQEAIDLLKQDPSSRQAVVVTWDPAKDGLLGVKQKNIPCLYTFTINIIGGRLNLHNIIRSNDMILGCPFDVLGFSLLLYILAKELNVLPGVYTHSISNAHIYETHYNIANELIKRPIIYNKIILNLESDTYQRTLELDKNIVGELYLKIDKQYKAREAIKGINIIL